MMQERVLAVARENLQWFEEEQVRKVTAKERVLEMAEGTLTTAELAERAGCSEFYAREVIRNQDRAEEPAVEVPQCQRCGFLDSPANPVVKVGDEYRCTWCRLEAAGVNLRAWYEGGGWRGVVEARQYEEEGERETDLAEEELRRRIRRELVVRGLSRRAAEREMGVAQDTVGRFLRGESQGFAPQNCLALAGWLGMEAGAVWEAAGYTDRRTIADGGG